MHINYNFNFETSNHTNTSLIEIIFFTSFVTIIKTEAFKSVKNK